MNSYVLLAGLWLLACTLIGLYVNGIGMKDTIHYKVGFVTLGVMFFLGISMLFAIIIFSL